MALLSKANHKSLCNGLRNSDGNLENPGFNAKLSSKFSNVELTSRSASGERYFNWLNDNDS